MHIIFTVKTFINKICTGNTRQIHKVREIDSYQELQAEASRDLVSVSIKKVSDSETEAAEVGGYVSGVVDPSQHFS